MVVIIWEPADFFGISFLSLGGVGVVFSSLTATVAEVAGGTEEVFTTPKPTRFAWDLLCSPPPHVINGCWQLLWGQQEGDSRPHKQ